MCVSLAHAINEGVPAFAGITFSPTQIQELRYAGLLHDFGKVYIDPSVFLKAKKLYDKDFRNLALRTTVLYHTLQLEFIHASPGAGESSPTVDQQRILDGLEDILKTLTALNEPTVTKDDPERVIGSILASTRDLAARDLLGEKVELLTSEDIRSLKVPRGTLNDEERAVIQSHVEHTFTFVSQIPWPEGLQNVAHIARRHHERLDGSGYPMGIVGREDNPLPSRIMAVADVFDALAAADRPYKKAVPLERCFAILREEAASGKLDSDVVELFIAKRVYRFEAARLG
jgi:response regulator RpfG family c-di-GMP phosphodiesterase